MNKSHHKFRTNQQRKHDDEHEIRKSNARDVFLEGPKVQSLRRTEIKTKAWDTPFDFNSSNYTAQFNDKPPTVKQQNIFKDSSNSSIQNEFSLHHEQSQHARFKHHSNFKQRSGPPRHPADNRIEPEKFITQNTSFDKSLHFNKNRDNSSKQDDEDKSCLHKIIVPGSSNIEFVSPHLKQKAKKKARPTKNKRLAALQTGKLHVLSPEVHDKIANQLKSDIPKFHKHQENAFININDISDYPELPRQKHNVAKSFQEFPVFNSSHQGERSSSKEPNHLTKNQVTFLSSQENFATLIGPNSAGPRLTNSDTIPIEEGTFRPAEEKERLQSAKITGKPCPREQLLAETKVTDGDEYIEVKDCDIIDILSKWSKVNLNARGPNALDATCPVAKRGKEREKPKVKKPSHLKKIILLERQRKKEESLENQDSLHPEGDVCEIDKSDVPHSNTSIPLENSTIFEEFSEDKIKLIELDHDGNQLLQNKADLQWDGGNLDNTITKAAQVVLHSKKFREYCFHLLSTELNELVTTFLQTLYRFQDRLYKKDAQKAHAKRRFIIGIREITKPMNLKKLKCVIIAPNLEDIKTEGGLNDVLAALFRNCEEFHVPCLFARDRSHLAKIFCKPVPISCIGIFNYEGTEATFRKIIDCVEESKKDYAEIRKMLENTLSLSDATELIQARESGAANIASLKLRALNLVFYQKDLETSKLSCKNITDFKEKYLLKI